MTDATRPALRFPLGDPGYPIEHHQGDNPMTDHNEPTTDPAHTGRHPKIEVFPYSTSDPNTTRPPLFGFRLKAGRGTGPVRRFRLHAGGSQDPRSPCHRDRSRGEVVRADRVPVGRGRPRLRRRVVTAISPADVIGDMADDIAKLARVGCCMDHLKPCEYHEGYSDGIDRLRRAIFSSEPIS